jgi:hypothetical protein
VSTETNFFAGYNGLLASCCVNNAKDVYDGMLKAFIQYYFPKARCKLIKFVSGKANFVVFHESKEAKFCLVIWVLHHRMCKEIAKIVRICENCYMTLHVLCSANLLGIIPKGNNLVDNLSFLFIYSAALQGAILG